MPYRTVNLLPQTYDRLRLYKLAGKSFDDVLLDFMARVPVADYHQDVLKAAGGKRQKAGQMRFETELSRSWTRMLRSRSRRPASGHRRR